MSKVVCKVMNPTAGGKGFSGGGVSLNLGPKGVNPSVVVAEKTVPKLIKSGFRVQVLGKHEEHAAPEKAAAPAPAPDPEPAPAPEPEPESEEKETSLVETLMESFTKAQLLDKASELELDTSGNKRALAERLAEGYSAEDLGV